MYTLVDRGGHLALVADPDTESREPYQATTYWVSNIPVAGCSSLLGAHVSFRSGNRGVTDHYNPIGVDITGWQCETVREPIAPPKNGRTYGWRWTYGKWQKDYFPRCPECYHAHDPSHLYCEPCNKCRPVKHKCLRVQQKGGRENA